MEIGSKVGYACGDTWVESTTVCKMAAEAHACGTDSAIAGFEREEVIDREG